MKQNIYDLFDRVSDIRIIKDKKEMIIELDKTLNSLEKVKEENNSDYYYLRAFINYSYPDKSPDRDMQIEKDFKKSLILDSGNEFCKYSYGAFLIDRKKYQESKMILEGIDFKYFKELGLDWRIIKGKEMILANRFYLSDNEKYPLLNKDLLSWTENLIQIVNSDIIYNYPGDIIIAVYSFCLKKAYIPQDLIESISKLLDLVKLLSLEKDVYTNEYKYIKKLL